MPEPLCIGGQLQRGSLEDLRYSTLDLGGKPRMPTRGLTDIPVSMFQVRIHGRGGQGVVTAAEMLSLAAFDEGRYAQAFPSFGSERMGAPVVSFCRIDDREIRVREPVMEPNALIIQDPTLLHQVDVFGGCKPDGFILINTAKSFDELGLGDFVKDFRHERLLTVPAGDLAREHTGRPVANAALLGGFAASAG